MLVFFEGVSPGEPGLGRQPEAREELRRFLCVDGRAARACEEACRKCPRTQIIWL